MAVDDEDEPFDGVDTSDDDGSVISDSGDSFEEDMDIYIGCLKDLAPTLEQTFYETCRPRPDAVGAEAAISFRVTDAAWGHVSKVHDKYRKADFGLAKRLGEANWRRYVRITRQMQRSAHELGEGETDDQETGRFASHAISKFHDSGLGTSIPGQSHFAASVASHTSFLSSQADVENGTLRVPPTPKEVAEELPFECFICAKTLTSIRNRVDWK